MAVVFWHDDQTGEGAADCFDTLGHASYNRPNGGAMHLNQVTESHGMNRGSGRDRVEASAGRRWPRGRGTRLPTDDSTVEMLPLGGIRAGAEAPDLPLWLQALALLERKQLGSLHHKIHERGVRMLASAEGSAA